MQCTFVAFFGAGLAVDAQLAEAAQLDLTHAVH